MASKVFMKSSGASAWLGQFDPHDQGRAADMLRAMRLVSANEFTRGMRALLLQTAEGVDGTVALYAEREVLPKDKKQPPEPLFLQPAERPRRAVGRKALIVLPGEDVGSEGLVAQLITELTREYPETFVNHPGPDLLRLHEIEKGRKKSLAPRVRKFVLVTDLIGSGNQAWRYLEAAWRVDSVKGLWSMRGGVSFEVVAFAATELGNAKVSSHAVQPVVRFVRECPTIDTVFDTEAAGAIKRLCYRYDPQSRPQWALGYESTGALMAFAHGAPNNTPAVLWASTDSWAALFPKRVTAESREGFGSVIDADAANERLLSMRQRRLDPGVDWSQAPSGALERYLVLAALAHPPRTAEAVARRSGLTLLEVKSLMADARKFEWIDHEGRLTDTGQAQLAVSKRNRVQISTHEMGPVYYPCALRAPA